jgi:16S rRNA (guanine527-N7)-methyltransferase
LSAATPALRADDAELAGLLSRGAADLALPLASPEVDRLIAYVRLIERWNATYNLTAIRDPRHMVVQHILDCLAAAAALGRRRGEGRAERLVDVGSGAGLPGVVLAIAFPEREITCVDSVGKKAAFITQAAGTLGLGNVNAIHARVESIVDRFDVIASRAFASLSEFVAETRHLLKGSGTWMAMKGKTPDEELATLAADLAFHVEPLRVPNLVAERCLVWIECREKRAHAHE